MRLFFLFLFFACFVNGQEEILYNWKLLKVADGDTIEFTVDFLPKELGDKLSVRIYGVDTPEKGWRAKSEKENEMGLAASDFTKKQIAAAKNIQVKLIGWDKYGGRVLGDVLLDGISLKDLLLKNGYAREYYGDKKQDW